MAVRKQQVKVYMSARKNGSTQVTGAAKAGISERTARRIERRGAGEKDRGSRHWRTRKDPFAEVWEAQLVPLLKNDAKLSAVALLEFLQEQAPERYPDTLLRTLQRRLKQWRAQHGPEQEVMFRQRYEPGQLGLSDFTELNETEITIAGEALAHRLYHFRLACSGWSYARVILGGESYAALAEGLGEALARLGGAPREHRTDSLSAAYRNLSKDERADVTARYQALCRHYRMAPSRNNRGRSHENGAVESSHGHLKRRLRDALTLRGSNDFPTLQAYRQFIDEVVAKHNRRNAPTVGEERAALQPLPRARAADYTELFACVTSAATINVRLVVYSVPSRLIGERLRVHLYDDRLACYSGSAPVLILPRVYPAKGKRRARRIDYRHLIGSLATKPMAFYRSQLRDDILPDATWRAAWQRLDARLEPREASRLMVGALKLAAHNDCQQALGAYLLNSADEGRLPTLVALQARFGPPRPTPPQVAVVQHTAADYDALIGAAASDGATVVQEVAHG